MKLNYTLKKTYIIFFIVFIVIFLFMLRTISMTKYEKGFNINIYNQTESTIPYIAFGALEPTHEFFDLEGKKTIKTHVNSMNGERVIVFFKEGENYIEEAIMYVMTKEDVHVINVYITDSSMANLKNVRIESLDGSSILPWWIRILYAYRTTELQIDITSVN
ncbi:MAG: hypothetical protein PHU31_07120 [Anaerotignum sp.]|nr:hypothetical protein [Anaerotignum sp.]